MFHRHTLLRAAVRRPFVAGGFSPCAGTAPFHSVSPNDLSTADWGRTGITPTTGQTDPSSGTTATLLTSTSGGIGGGAKVQNSPGTFTMNTGTTYTFGAYFKSIAGPTWVQFGISDNTANASLVHFDISGSGTVGAVTNVGNALNTCAQIGSAGNGYVQISIGVTVGSNNAGMTLQFYLADGNGTGNSTVGQQVNAWQVCP